MKKFYRKAMEDAGYPEGSEKYKKIDQCFNTSLRAYQRDYAERRKLAITFKRLSTFIGDDSNSNECFASDEDVEEKILHEIELDQLRECLNRLSREDKELLLRYYGGERGELAKIARELGVSYEDIRYRIKKLIKRLRRMMGVY